MTSLPSPSPLADETLAELIAQPLLLDERDDLETLVPALPALAFVKLARGLRDEGRLDLLLPVATPEQLVSLFDFEAWKLGRIRHKAGRAWLEKVVAEIYKSDLPRGALSDLMYEMDPEMWSYLLARDTVVATIDLENDASRQEILEQLSDRLTYETPDGFFVVGVPDNSFGQSAIRILDTIYTDNLAEGRKLLLSIEALIPAQAEEELEHWRRGRLEDLGFPEWETAMELLRPRSVQELKEFQSANRYVPEYVDVSTAAVTHGDELWASVFARLSVDEQGIRARELMLVANTLLVAQRWEPGEVSHQQQALTQAQATIRLAFDLVLRENQHPDPTQVLADAVNKHGLRLLFQVGYDPLAKLRKAALALHKIGPVSYKKTASLLDRPWGPAIAAFTNLIPAMPLDPDRAPPREGYGHRAIALISDLTAATKLLAQAGALLALAHHPEGFAIAPFWTIRCDSPEKLRTGDLIRTALVLEALGRPRDGFAPLDAATVTEAGEKLLENGRLLPRVREIFAARCVAAGVGGHAGPLGQVVLTRLEYELCNLEQAEDETGVDLGRVEGLLTARHASIWLGTGMTALDREDVQPRGDASSDEPELDDEWVDGEG